MSRVIVVESDRRIPLDVSRKLQRRVEDTFGTGYKALILEGGLKFKGVYTDEGLEGLVRR